MKLPLLLLCAAMIASSMSFGQTVPSTNPSPTWDIFGGGSLMRGVGSNSTPNYYGWDASVSERPYAVHPWIGGTIDVSGAYRNTTIASELIDDGVYTIMGGPSFAVRFEGVQPFARVLLGGIIDRTATSTNGQNSVSVQSGHFGTDFGGGVDVKLSQRFAARGQVDWIRVWNSNLQSGNFIKASFGPVLRF